MKRKEKELEKEYADLDNKVKDILESKTDGAEQKYHKLGKLAFFTIHDFARDVMDTYDYTNISKPKGEGIGKNLRELKKSIAYKRHECLNKLPISKQEELKKFKYYTIENENVVKHQCPNIKVYDPDIEKQYKDFYTLYDSIIGDKTLTDQEKRDKCLQAKQAYMDRWGIKGDPKKVELQKPEYKTLADVPYPTGWDTHHILEHFVSRKTLEAMGLLHSLENGSTVMMMPTKVHDGDSQKQNSKWHKNYLEKEYFDENTIKVFHSMCEWIREQRFKKLYPVKVSEKTKVVKGFAEIVAFEDLYNSPEDNPPGLIKYIDDYCDRINVLQNEFNKDEKKFNEFKENSMKVIWFVTLCETSRS